MMLIIAPLSLPAKPLSPTVNPFKNLNLPKMTPKFQMRRLSEASACTAEETLTKTTTFTVC